MKFDKWQALGNDYIILEEGNLPWELTPERVKKLCAPHFGCDADGILLLSRPSDPKFVSRLRIFNPDGSEAELSGNGAREATLYLRQTGWTAEDTFSIETAAGEIRPTVTGPATCSIEMGQAKLESKDFIGETPTIEADGRSWEFVHVSIGNPHAVIEVEGGLEDLDLSRVGPAVENASLFPNRTNVEFISRIGNGAVRARIWERGVGETLASGTGASASAVAAVVKGTSSPVTVVLDGGELEIDVSEDLHVRMMGPAHRVFVGEFSQGFMETLG